MKIFFGENNSLKNGLRIIERTFRGADDVELDELNKLAELMNGFISLEHGLSEQTLIFYADFEAPSVLLERDLRNRAERMMHRGHLLPSRIGLPGRGEIEIGHDAFSEEKIPSLSRKA